MKKIILLVIISMFVTRYVCSQEYFPFAPDNAKWNVLLVTYPYCKTNLTPDSTLLCYAILGDTTINETTYRKLVRNKGSLENPRHTTVGAFREENRKVYYIGETFLYLPLEQEVLLYDFSAQKGDTIKQNDYIYSVVTGIDSILIGDTYRKRFQVEHNSFFHNPDYIVEGIGSIKNGLFGLVTDGITGGSFYWEHICYHENEEVYYLNPKFDECYPESLISFTTDLKKELNISIYPNPSNKEIMIEMKFPNQNLHLKLINTAGNIVKQQALNNETSIITLPDASDLYFVIIEDAEGNIIKRSKLIKE